MSAKDSSDSAKGVARCGSIRKAAESLHMASSALNRRILDLDEEVGTLLFERLPRGVRLTAASEVYVNYVRPVLADTELVGSQIERLRGLVRGQVKVAATESVAGHLLSSAVVKFQADHPGVYFEITIVAAEKLVEMVTSDTRSRCSDQLSKRSWILPSFPLAPLYLCRSPIGSHIA